MSFNAIREKKIIAKISEFTVYRIEYRIAGFLMARLK